MEYPELLPIVLAILLIGFFLSSSSFIQRKIAAEQARFQSGTRCFVALVVIVASYGLLALPSSSISAIWFFAVGAGYRSLRQR